MIPSGERRRGAARTLLAATLCITGLALGSVSLALAMVAPEGPSATGEGTLLVTATRVDSGNQGLEPGDPEALAALVPGLAVGGARELVVTQSVPRVPARVALRVIAADPAWAALAGLRVAKGRALDAEDERTGAAVCVLSPRASRLLEPGAARIKLDESWWTVVGVLAEPERETAAVDVLLPLHAGMLRLVPQDEAGLGELRIIAPDGPGALANRVSRALAALHGGQGAWRVEGQEAPSVCAVQERAIRGLLFALGACALLLGGLALRGWREAGGPMFGTSLGMGVAVGLAGSAVAMLAGSAVAGALGLAGTVAPLGLALAVVGPVVGVAIGAAPSPPGSGR
ncbi:MAG: ABC transporter permease [Pseudomonadota bacterium]